MGRNDNTTQGVTQLTGNRMPLEEIETEQAFSTDFYPRTLSIEIPLV